MEVRRDIASQLKPVSLFTMDGGFVAQFRDPAFELMTPKPDVLMWGIRVFGRVTDACYKEGLAFAMVTEPYAVEVEPEFEGEDVDIFVLNVESGEVHHKNSARAACRLNEIAQLEVVPSLAYARNKRGADLCGWCFKSAR